MKIIERLRLQHRTIPITTAPNPKLEKELKDTKADLNSILTNWTFDKKPLKSAEEFIEKFEKWIGDQLKIKQEVQNFLKLHKVNNLAEVKLVNTSESEQLKFYKENIKIKEQIIEDLKKNKGGLSEEDKEKLANYEELELERYKAQRKKEEMEQECLALNNQLKLKQQEVSKKDKEIKNLKSDLEVYKKEGQEWRAKKKELEELKKKYSKQGQLLDTESLECKKLEEENEKLKKKIEDFKAENLNLIKQLSKGPILE